MTPMAIEFNINNFVEYLDRYKCYLSTLYKWNPKIDRLVSLETLSKKQVEEINALTPYEKELQLKKIVGQKLNDTLKSNLDLFYKLCLWVIKDWGGITTASDKDTLTLIKNFLEEGKPSFSRIASTSKVGGYLFPDRNVIYDSRVAYSINWIILSENAGQQYFPIPEGRNSKMSAFDLSVLIRLKNISVYQPTDIKDLDQKFYIKNCDKKLFIDKNDAYCELNNLVKQISQKLWEGDKEKQQNLYFTEMLLFSIADREVFMDITTKYRTN
jgi:hypothetical protein